jgi:hypothetical protein
MTRVIRCCLPTTTASLTFWATHGPFRYAVTGYGDATRDPDLLLHDNEWIFADDRADLVQTLLQWEARQVHAVGVVPPPAAVPGDDEGPEPAWEIRNLPDAVDEYMRCLLHGLPILGRPAATPAEVEAAVIDWLGTHLDLLEEVLVFDFAKDSFEAFIRHLDSGSFPPLR